MKTYGVKYLGSKNKLIPQIAEIVNRIDGIDTALDVFTGTTRVAQAFRNMGIRVVSSDISSYSAEFAKCYIGSTHDDVIAAMPFIHMLNNPKMIEEGWITKNYADVTAQGNVVRFIHPKNAQRADSIRRFIEEQYYGPAIKSILVTSLIEAMDRVDNTVGIQQAYLKNWCKRSLDDLVLRVPVIPTHGPVGSHIQGDVLQIDYPNVDLAYVDPPYSPHSYSTYYHIWESIAKWDKPDVGLKTNRRADMIGDKAFKSQWNGPGALTAFETLFSRLPAKYILVSYADDSKLVSYNDLRDLCQRFGSVTVTEIDYKRNIMSTIGNAAMLTEKVTKNHELLFTIKR